jgi:hypothetical protein
MGTAITPAAAEGSECAAYFDCVTAPDPERRRRAGAEWLLVGGGAAFSVRDDSSRFWTKALGFGFAEPVTGDLIGRLTDFYRDQRAPSASIELAPPVIPADWDAICAKENLSAGAKLAKLACEPEAVLANVRTDLDEGLRVQAVTSARRTEFSTAIARVFGMDGEYPVAIMAATVERPR